MFDLKAGEIVEYSRSLLMNEGIVGNHLRARKLKQHLRDWFLLLIRTLWLFRLRLHLLILKAQLSLVLTLKQALKTTQERLIL